MWNPFRDDTVEHFPPCDGLFVVGERSSPLRHSTGFDDGDDDSAAEERLSVGMLSLMSSGGEFPILPAQKAELVLEEHDDFWDGPLQFLRSPGLQAADYDEVGQKNISNLSFQKTAD